MAFTVNMSGTAELDDSIIQEFDQQFIIAAADEGIVDQFVSYRKMIGAESIKLPKYSRLSLATTPLVEKDDVTSEAMVDAPILLTPEEYGNVVTPTKLVSLQTGGVADIAAARLTGQNMGQTSNKLGLLALDASTNVSTVDGGAENALDAADVMTASYLNKQYNKLARQGVKPLSDGMYVALMHDDVIHDLRADNSAGSWYDINKNSRPEEILKNEVGQLAGFKIVRDSNSSINVDGGAANVDTYKSYFMGFNALGKADSEPAHGTLTGPFDKLARFVNVGWYGVFKYGIIDQDALHVGITASSVGDNA